MATPTVKTTYALDVETVRALEGMARRWGVSKSEALRRTIRAAAHGPAPGAPKTLAALSALQRSLDLSSDAAARWARQTKRERRTSSIRHESK